MASNDYDKKYPGKKNNEIHVSKNYNSRGYGYEIWHSAEKHWTKCASSFPTAAAARSAATKKIKA